ncbi:hypothetical protein FUMI01_16800 [Flavobacterium sp. UMI-01]|nr:hypothetical protein FUMI01_16800 [Flavobacterium sp. UMI-01]
MSEDLPTLDLPMKAYSGKKSFGHFEASELLTINSAVLIFILMLYLIGNLLKFKINQKNKPLRILVL